MTTLFVAVKVAGSAVVWCWYFDVLTGFAFAMPVSCRALHSVLQAADEPAAEPAKEEDKEAAKEEDKEAEKEDKVGHCGRRDSASTDWQHQGLSLGATAALASSPQVWTRAVRAACNACPLLPYLPS